MSTDRLEMEMVTKGDPFERMMDAQKDAIGNWLNDGSVTSEHIEKARRVMMGIAARTFDKWTFLDFVSFQPMSMPTSLIFYLAFNHRKAMTESDIKVKVAQHALFLENVREGRADSGCVYGGSTAGLKTVEQYEEMVRSEATMIPEIDLMLKSLPVVARAYRVTMSKKYMDTFSLDMPSDDMIELISDEIAETYNYQIWTRLSELGIQYETTLDTLITDVMAASGKAFKKAMVTFGVMGVSSNLKDKFDWSLLDKRFEIFFIDELAANTIVLTNNGKSFLENGFVFSPYTVLASNIWDENQFIYTDVDDKTPSAPLLMTRYAVKGINEYKYATMKVVQ